MNEAAKKAYLDKVDAQLREWGAKVDVVKARMDMATADARIDAQKHLESWQKKRTVLNEKIAELRAAGVDKFDVMKSGVQKIWSELGELVTSIEAKK